MSNNYKYKKNNKYIGSHKYDDAIKRLKRNIELESKETFPKWIDPLNPYKKCEVSVEEFENAAKIAARDIKNGIKPNKKGVKPILYLALGSAGAGKSTITPYITKKLDPDREFIIIDMDLAVKYHPRYKGIWGSKNVFNDKNLSVGFTLTRHICNLNLEDIMELIFKKSIENKKYNIIFQTQDIPSVIMARKHGYEIKMLYVGTKLKIAKNRSMKRAVKTGKFLAPNLRVQDRVVKEMWVDFIKYTPWYGLWADKLILCDNNYIVETFKSIKMKDLEPIFSKLKILDPTEIKRDKFIKQATEYIEKATDFKNWKKNHKSSY